MAIDKEKLAEMMGEKNIVRPAQQQYPIVRLQGTKGVFLKLAVGKDGYEDPKDLGQMLEGEIIAVRRQLSEYTKNYTRSSNEFDEITDEVIVWERAKVGAGAEIFRGKQGEARQAYQGLRSRYWLYMLVNGDLVKVMVKGAGLGNLFEYFHELKDMHLHIFEVKTRIEPAFEKNDSGMEYYAMSFSNAGAVDEALLGQVAVKLQAFHENLKELREAYQKKGVAAPQPEPETVEEIPVIDLEAEPEAEDIPL
jgi:hypothetical protein